MEEQRKMTVHLEMKFSTAFIIGLAFALAGLVVMIVPWIVVFAMVGSFGTALSW